MDAKKIVVFFGKKTGCSDPFRQWPTKKAVYHKLFAQGIEQGFEMYFVPNHSHYEDGYQFKNPWQYSLTDHLFHPTQKTITADAVYDRSGGLLFPRESFDTKILNSRNFKALCGDKNLMQNLLGKSMPLGFSVSNQEEFFLALQKFSPKERVVLKPATGFGGKGIVIAPAEEIKSFQLLPKTTYTLQQFIDTSRGIENITPSYHDLRVVIANGKKILAHVRTPGKDSLLANVAQGGSIKEVPLQDIPSFILSAVEEVQKNIDTRFDFPLYSIDFGIENEKAYVFEINDTIGFPSEAMAAHEEFIQQILTSLSRRALLP